MSVLIKRIHLSHSADIYKGTNMTNALIFNSSLKTLTFQIMFSFV